MESRVSYNVCIAMENRCRIHIFGDFVCNERNCAENKTRRHPGRSMPENGIGWEKTRQAVNDAVITRPFRVRMRLARQLFIYRGNWYNEWGGECLTSPKLCVGEVVKTVGFVGGVPK